MMTVLLVFKTLSMLFESIRYHYLRLTGSAEAWSIVYYLFAFLKGITLFVVVLLIGTGWSLIKPFLNKKDKQIILVVLSLQVKRLKGALGRGRTDHFSVSCAKNCVGSALSARRLSRQVINAQKIGNLDVARMFY